MKMFEVEVKETLSRVVKLEAENTEEALSIVTGQYSEENIVLDYTDFIGVEFIDINSPTIISDKDRLISEVIDYLYADEEKHFEESDKPDGHIFNKLKKLKSILELQ